jgi:hypothetical protein
MARLAKTSERELKKNFCLFCLHRWFYSETRHSYRVMRQVFPHPLRHPPTGTGSPLREGRPAPFPTRKNPKKRPEYFNRKMAPDSKTKPSGTVPA